jgi:hypothetical protein
MIEGISAVTLGTHEMPRAVRFYRALGFEVLHGGEDSSFTSFRAGTSCLNLIVQSAEQRWSWWGRVIFYVADVDALGVPTCQIAWNSDPAMPNGVSVSSISMTATAANSVSLDLCSRLPSNSSSKPPDAFPHYPAPAVRNLADNRSPILVRPIEMGPTGNVSEQGFDGSGQHYRNRSTGAELNMSEGSSPLESWSLRTSACSPHVGRRVDFDFRHLDRLMTSTVRSQLKQL